MSFADQDHANPANLTLYLGPSIGQGTSGIVYPIVSSADGKHSLKRDMLIHRTLHDDRSVPDFDCPTSVAAMRYVAKEVKLDENTRSSILKEVYLHKTCSKNCSGVVQYLFSGEAHGENPTLIVVMGACKGELWDVLCAYRQDVFRSVSKGSVKPGLERQASGVSTSSCGSGSSKITSYLPSEGERLSWTQCLCETVLHCHELGVIHRDLNPWNVLIAAERNTDASRRICLADFGLAVRLPSPLAELSGLESEDAVALDASALGSLYSAPELGVQYGLPADVFSLGMVLLAIWSTVDVSMPDGGQCEDALVTCTEGVKQAAMDGVDAPHDVLKSIKEGRDSGLRALIMRMVSARPQERPTAAEACKFVECWLADRGSHQGGDSMAIIEAAGTATKGATTTTTAGTTSAATITAIGDTASLGAAITEAADTITSRPTTTVIVDTTTSGPNITEATEIHSAGAGNTTTANTITSSVSTASTAHTTILLAAPTEVADTNTSGAASMGASNDAGSRAATPAPGDKTNTAGAVTSATVDPSSAANVAEATGTTTLGAAAARSTGEVAAGNAGGTNSTSSIQGSYLWRLCRCLRTPHNSKVQPVS